MRVSASALAVLATNATRLLIIARKTSKAPRMCTRASLGPDDIDEYAFVVVFQVGQFVGEVNTTKYVTPDCDSHDLKNQRTTATSCGRFRAWRDRSAAQSCTARRPFHQCCSIR